MRLLILLIFIIIPNIFFAQQRIFELIESIESGISFNNIVKDSREQNILKYANFYGGGGVGLADFNNDGLTDIYFTGNLLSLKTL